MRGPMTPDESELNDFPVNQFLAPELVMVEMAEVGARRAMQRTPVEVLVLSILAGGFITIGALFSTVIAAGTTNEGVKRILEGFGFSVGFFLVVLSGAMLFTEVNVEMPATLFGSGWRATRALAPLTLGAGCARQHDRSRGCRPGRHDRGDLLARRSANSWVRSCPRRCATRTSGGIEGWSKAVLSGVLGNWLVGMAAFLAVMGRTIIGKYIPVFLVVTAFVASGFLHSPANMAYFSLANPVGIGPSWGAALEVEHPPRGCGQRARRLLPRGPALLVSQPAIHRLLSS